MGDFFSDDVAELVASNNAAKNGEGEEAQKLLLDKTEQKFHQRLLLLILLMPLQALVMLHQLDRNTLQSLSKLRSKHRLSMRQAHLQGPRPRQKRRRRQKQQTINRNITRQTQEEKH